MPYATNPDDDIQIYYETEGAGPPLVLLHPFTLSLESWRQTGYTAALAETSQLTLIDLRGHGKSDKPRRPPMHSLEKQTGDIIAVLDDLNIANARFVGYSLGARIALAMSKLQPERVASIIAGGQLAGQYMADFPVPLDANDNRVLVGINRQVVWEQDFFDGLEQVTSPALLYAGQLDPFASQVRNVAACLPARHYIELAGLDQVDAFVQSETVLSEVFEQEFQGET